MENIRKKRRHRKEIQIGHREGEKHQDEVGGRDVPPVGKRASHNLWWCEQVPAWVQSSRHGAPVWRRHTEQAYYGSWWSGLGHQCGTLGTHEVNGRKTLSPPLVWKRRWEYRKPELHTCHLPMVPESDQIWVPGTENQQPADKSLLVLPPWQPLNESMNLHRCLSAFSSLLPK